MRETHKQPRKGKKQVAIREYNGTLRDRQGILACVNEEYAEQRTDGELPSHVSDWTMQTLASWQAAGYRAWLWDRSSDNQIVAVLIGSVENFIRAPDVTPKPWFAAKILAKRGSLLPSSLDKEKALLRAAQVAIPQMRVDFGTVGTVAEVANGNTKLLAFFQKYFPNALSIEDRGTGKRCWLRYSTGLTEFAAAQSGLNP